MITGGEQCFFGGMAVPATVDIAAGARKNIGGCRRYIALQGRVTLIIILDVLREAKPQLLKIAGATTLARVVPRAGEYREQNCRQEPYYRNNYK
jgi:hypothetical protein